MIKTRLKTIWDSQKHLAWLAANANNYRGKLLLICVCQLVIPLSTIIGAVLSKTVIDAAVAKEMDTFVYFLILFAASQLLNLLLSAIVPYLAGTANEQISNHLQYSFLQRYYSIEWQSVNAYHTGDILTRLTSDVRNITSFYTGIMPMIWSIIVEFVLAFVILFNYDPYLALFGFLLTPVVVLLSLIFGKKIKGLQRALQDNEGQYRSYVHESIQHLVVIKCFNSYRHMMRRISGFQNQRMQIADNLNRQILKAGLIGGFGFKTSFLLAFVWGAYRIYTGHITFGVFIAFLQLMGHIQSPLSSAAQLFPRLMATLTSLDRYRQFETYPVERTPLSTPPQAAPIGIHIENLSFSYHTDRPLLKHMSLQIFPGETIALVGSSGIGKTTFIRLLLELIHPQEGFINLNGTLSSFPTNRSSFTYVPQGNTLFSGTIAENLSVANELASERDIADALSIACADVFVAELPDGIHTMIGENGLGLSEGQAQRLCIARALLRDAPIILLDEATSALDPQTEATILSRIRSRLSHKTCIAVTHRDTVSQLANRIIRIENHTLTIEKGCKATV